MAVAAASILLLAAGLTACGSNDASGDGESTSAKSTEATESGSSNDELGDFTPKHHDDSGDGSAQFIGMGSDDFAQEYGVEVKGPEFEEAAAALHSFLDARVEHELSAACVYLAQSTAESLQELSAQTMRNPSCAKALKIEPEVPPAEASQADVASLRAEDGTGYLFYRGAKDGVHVMPMAQDKGSWKVLSVTAIPLPP